MHSAHVNLCHPSVLYIPRSAHLHSLVIELIGIATANERTNFGIIFCILDGTRGAGRSRAGLPVFRVNFQSTNAP